MQVQVNTTKGGVQGHWLQDMLAIIDQEIPGAKERILERVRQRLMGRSFTPVDTAKDTAVAEQEQGEEPHD